METYYTKLKVRHKGIKYSVTTKFGESLDSRFGADLVLQILSYVANKERDNTRSRQRQGIDIITYILVRVKKWISVTNYLLIQHILICKMKENK